MSIFPNMPNPNKQSIYLQWAQLVTIVTCAFYFGFELALIKDYMRRTEGDQRLLLDLRKDHENLERRVGKIENYVGIAETQPPEVTGDVAVDGRKRK